MCVSRMREVMQGDCQSRELEEWLRSLGFQEGLQQTALQKLNTLKMRSIWRHLQATVFPNNEACTIRKNVLHRRLEEENIVVDQFLNFELDSLKQLSKVKEFLKLKEEKNKILEEIKMMDAKIKNENNSLMQKNAVIERESHKLSETENKTLILELKKAKLVKDCKKVNSEKETVAHLKSSKTLFTYKDLNYQKSTVCKYAKNYKYPLRDTDDDSNYLCDMMCSILDFKPETVLDGIAHSAKEALCSLNYGVNFENDMFSSGKMIKDLKILIVRKGLEIFQYQEKLNSGSEKLNEEQGVLIKKWIVKSKPNSEEGKCNERGSIESGEIYPENCQEEEKKNSQTKLHVKDYAELNKALSDNDKLNNSLGSKSDESESGDGNLKNHLNEKSEVGKDENFSCEVLDGYINKIQKVQKNEKIVKYIDQLKPYKLEYLNLKQSITDLTTKDDELWKEVEKKVNEINLVLSILFNGKINSGELNELLSEIFHLAKDFKAESSQVCKTIDSSKLTDMISKEIEVFRGIPMNALQRKWNKSIDDYQMTFLNNITLPYFLLPREGKNSIVNVLEKILWSLNMLQINEKYYEY